MPVQLRKVIKIIRGESALHVPGSKVQYEYFYGPSYRFERPFPFYLYCRISARKCNFVAFFFVTTDVRRMLASRGLVCLRASLVHPAIPVPGTCTYRSTGRARSGRIQMPALADDAMSDNRQQDWSFTSVSSPLTTKTDKSDRSLTLCWLLLEATLG
jgi:hypothetical protein